MVQISTTDTLEHTSESSDISEPNAEVINLRTYRLNKICQIFKEIKEELKETILPSISECKFTCSEVQEEMPEVSDMIKELNGTAKKPGG